MSEISPIGGAWCSYYPLLAAALEHVDGPVLELGAGDGSTPYLNESCRLRVRERHVRTFDSNQDWLAKYDHLAFTSGASSHRLFWTGALGGWDGALRLMQETEWGVALIDHAPGERRVVEIAALAHRAKVLVLHDTETGSCGNYNFESIWHLFKYIRHDDRLPVRASLVSNFVDPTSWQLLPTGSIPSASPTPGTSSSAT